VKYALRACEIFALRANVKEKSGRNASFFRFCFILLFAPQKASLTFCEAKYIAAPKGAISLNRKVEYRSPQGEYR
jgi:hypothetical protein